jgi:hypothetical protein
MLAEELKKIFQDLEPKKEKSFERCQIGFILEKKYKALLQKSTRANWHFKNKRPAKIIYVSDNEVYFILFSTSPWEYYCSTDFTLGIQTKSIPKVDLTECDLNENCHWFKSGKISKPLKFKFHKYCYVISLHKKLFEAIFTPCGKCSEDFLPPLLKKIVEYELKKYQRRKQR